MTNFAAMTAQAPYHRPTAPAYITDSSNTLSSCGSDDFPSINDNNDSGYNTQRQHHHQQDSMISDNDSTDGTYHDYFRQDINTIKRQIEMPKGKRRGPRGGVVVPFPVKLYAMLEGVEKEGLEDVVSWLPHGRCFIVHKPSEFVKDIMPRYFRQSKLTSFQRQLNLYGFMRLSTGRDRGAYWHELFLRGRPDLCKIMLRTRVKGNGMKPPPTPTTEPDFYEYPVCSNRQLNLPAKPTLTKPVRAQSELPDIEPTPIPLMYPLQRRETSSNETLKQALDIFGVAEIDNLDGRYDDDNNGNSRQRDITPPLRSIATSVPQWRSTPFSLFGNANSYTTPATYRKPLATVSPMPIAQVSNPNIPAPFIPDVSAKSTSTSSTVSNASSNPSSIFFRAASSPAPMTVSSYSLPTPFSNSINRNGSMSSNTDTRNSYRRLSANFSDAETGFFEGHKFAFVDGASLEEFESNMI